MTIRIARLVCPVDFSECSWRALRHAGAIAHRYDAHLTVVHVVVSRPAMDAPPEPLTEAERIRISDDLRRAAAEWVPSSVDFDVRVVEAPDVRVELLAQLDVAGADLLVLGSHGTSGFRRVLLGSVTERVMREARCPTLIVPPGAARRSLSPEFHRILCPVDFSEGSSRALAYAVSLAGTHARLTLLHVVEMPPELVATLLGQQLDVDALHAAAEADALDRMRALVPPGIRTGCGLQAKVLEGAAYRQILRVAAAEESHLIVMGVHGRGGIDRLVFGSNTARVARAAVCPVLVVPSVA